MSYSIPDDATQYEDAWSSTALLKTIVHDLFSYDAIKQRRILEFYFIKDAILASPWITTQGIQNIINIYAIWPTINQCEPTIHTIVFDGHTAVVHYTQHLSPVFLPSFVRISIPAITTLYFQEHPETGLIKVVRQQDSWTMDGLLESIPLVSFLYSRVLRTTIGSLASAAGHRLGDCSWQQHMYAWQQPANEKCIVDNDNHLVDGVVWLDEADDE